MRPSQRWFVVIATAVSFLSGSAASAADKALTPQQQRMADCNQQASGKTGDERKSFMSSCLKGGTSATDAKPSTPQERMKTCNADATSKALKGADRKSFMSTCLKSATAGGAAN
jgi:hypothetical protein